MKKENILSACLLVELDIGHRTGLTHAENEYLHCENTYLKKAGAGGEAGEPAGSPVWAEEETSVTALRWEYPLALLLRVSGMSRSTHYHRWGRCSAESPGARRTRLIAEAFACGGREYGCR